MENFNKLFEGVRARYIARGLVFGKGITWDQVKQLTEAHARKKYHIIVNLEGGLKRLIEIQVYARFRASSVPDRIFKLRGGEASNSSAS